MKTDRRSLLYGLGILSVTPLMAWQKPANTAVVVAKPDENLFACANPQQGKVWPYKLTSEDSAGTLSIFELHTMPRSGSVRHVHYRGDEWSYVLSGDFVFEAGDKSTTCSRVEASGSPKASLTYGRTGATPIGS
jgi:hypothetical protein